MIYSLFMENLSLKNIQPVLDKFTEEKNAAGLNLLVYKDGSELGYWQSGYADLETGRHYSRDTIVRLYSMTKPVTAVAAMLLIEEGKLDFADELYRYLPEYKNLKICQEKGREGRPVPACKPILIQDLLNMTSGYTYGAWSPDAPLGEQLTSILISELNKDQAEGGANSITTREVASCLASIPVSFEPGSDYNYGLSADILGAVIEEVAGTKLGNFMKSRIFEPLGMSDTDFYVPEEKQLRLAQVYRSLENFTDSIEKHQLEPFTECNLGIQSKMNHKPVFESGGAGLCSTIDDYMKFALMLTNGGKLDGCRILSEKTVKYLSQARLSPTLQQRFDMKMPHLAGYTYCNLMRVAVEPGRANVITEKGEFGWDGWLGPYVSIDLENKLTIVMTMQRCDSGTTGAARRVRNIIYSAIS